MAKASRGIGLQEQLCAQGPPADPTTSHSASDELRSSASSSACRTSFAFVSDTVVITGQPVADPGVAYAIGRLQ